MTNLIMFCRHSNNTTIFSVSNTPLHWAQLRVSTLCIGHHQVVLKLFEQIYNKLCILGGGGWSVFSVVNMQLHWVQLHVSTLCIGHHQVVLRLVVQLHNKRIILGWRGLVGRDLVFITVSGITLGSMKLPLNHLSHQINSPCLRL